MTDGFGFLTTEGRVASLMRGIDWSRSPLGRPEGWPDLLRSTLATMLTSPQAMFLSWGPEQTFLYNDAYEAILGRKAEGGPGRPFREVWPDVWDEIAPIVERAYAGQGSSYEDFPLTMLRHGVPEETWWTFSYNPLRDGTGAVRGMLCVTLETSARQLSERQARAERARMAALFEQAPGFMATLEGPDHRIVQANPALVRLVGGRDVLGRPVAEALPEAAEQGFVALLDRVRETGEAFSARDTRYAAPREPGGPLVEQWVDFVFQPMRGPDGAVGAIFVQGHDVTEAHLAHADLRESEARLREANESLERRVSERGAELRLLGSIIETADALILVADTDFRWLAVNRAAAQAFERAYGARPRVGASMLDPLADRPDHREQVYRYWARALAGEAYSATDVFGDPAYRPRSFEVKFEPLRDRDGRVTGAFQIATDVTDRLQGEARLAEAEAQLRQAQKMEAIGQLTGGVAHDFNNLLTPIVGALDVLQRRALGGPREHRLIEGAIQSAERARTLVQRLLAFARRQPLQTGPVDIADLVEGLRHLVVSTAGPQVRVTVHVADGLPAAVADANQLEMAILNLAVNARDAMPQGGTLTLSAAREEVGPDHPQRLAPGTYLRLWVEDTGEGMDGATLARAVEPFFSTKGVGRGTGLGLSMVHGLALQLGGALDIESELGRGTRVTLWLPAAGRPATVRRMGPPAPSRAHAGAALLVDDEPLVREATSDMLAELGYRVTAAASGEEALRIVEGGMRFDLLVTDHLMPGMSGTDLALRLRAARPDLPVLIVSGYAEAQGLAPGLPRLPKPFRRDELAASLERMRRA